jgi:hypothetical protein
LKLARRCQKLAGYNSDGPPPHFKEVTQGHYSTRRTTLSRSVKGLIGHLRCRWSRLVFFTARAVMLRFWCAVVAIEARPTAAEPALFNRVETHFAWPAGAIKTVDRVD